MTDSLISTTHKPNFTPGDRDRAQAQEQVFNDAARELGLSQQELHHKLTEIRRMSDKQDPPTPGSVKEWVIHRMHSMPLPTRK